MKEKLYGIVAVLACLAIFAVLKSRVANRGFVSEPPPFVIPQPAPNFKVEPPSAPTPVDQYCKFLLSLKDRLGVPKSDKKTDISDPEINAIEHELEYPGAWITYHEDKSTGKPWIRAVRIVNRMNIDMPFAVNLGTPQKKIISTFGKPRETLKGDSLLIYDYDSYDLTFELKEDVIVSIHLDMPNYEKY